MYHVLATTPGSWHTLALDFATEQDAHDGAAEVADVLTQPPAARAQVWVIDPAGSLIQYWDVK